MGDRPPLQTVVVIETTPERGHRGTRPHARKTSKKVNANEAQKQKTKQATNWEHDDQNV